MPDTQTLTAERVEIIFYDCLFEGDEDAGNYILAEGIVTNVGFKPDMVEKHRQVIHEMLGELPDQFKSSTGAGGWSFLNACMDKHGNQWTGMHTTMERLIQLGIAIGEVEYCLPRAVWNVLPGGVPYFVVKQ